jgi:hypothetical protein
MSKANLIKKISDDTGAEIARAEKYVKDLKKFRAAINPRTAPRKKKKNKINSVKDNNIKKIEKCLSNVKIFPKTETVTGYKTEFVSTKFPNNETNITIAS